MPADAPDDGKLADLSASGSPVKSRIADAAHALAIAKRFVADDRARASRRLKVQGLFNGNAPKDAGALQRSGRGGDSNLNFRKARGHVMNAAAPLHDLVFEVPLCIDGDLEYGDSGQDAELMRGFAEYFHDLLFGWTGFDSMTQLCDLQFLLHGTGIIAWEDQWDWRPKAILAGNFFVPSETTSSLDNCELAMLLTPMSSGALWRKITEPTQPGWNVEAVRRVIMDSALSGSDMRQQSWNGWEQAFKNGDQYVSQTQTRVIALYTLFVEEMDGTISQKIVPAKEGAANKPEFIFESDSRYESWDQCICLFPYDIGADGTFHGIKGLGTDIYPFCVLLNEIDNSIADLVTSGIKPMWQPTSAGDMSKFQMAKWGGGNMVPNGINPLQLNIGSSIAPALEVSRGFNQTLTSNTAAANVEDLAAPTVEETAKSAMIRASERAKLTKGMHSRIMRGKDRQYAETWRRAVNPKLRAHHPGGKEALKFQERCHKLCKKLGVPNEALQAVENVRANRSLGLGSAAMRIEIVNQLLNPNFLDRLDPVGQNNVLRDFVSVMTSFHNVDAIVPSLTTGRDATNDASVAASENNSMSILGPEAEVIVVPGQNHVIHLESHVGSMENDAELCRQGQQEPRECQKRLMAKGAHSDEHLKALEGNPTRKDEFKQFSARLKELEGFAQEIAAVIEQEDQAAAEEPQPGAPDPAVLKVEHDAALRRDKQGVVLNLKAQKQQFDQEQKARQAAFDMRIKDLATAAEIERKNAAVRTNGNA